MFYKFNDGLVEINNNEIIGNELLFAICAQQDLDELANRYSFSRSTIKEYIEPQGIVHKMDSYYGYNFGLFHVRQIQNDKGNQKKIGMYITTNMVIIICDDKELKHDIFEIIDKTNERNICLEHIVSSILNYIINGHLKMLENIENHLAAIDEDIINNKTEGFNQKTRKIRNELLSLTHYYEQLMDVCDELLQDENDFFIDEEVHHLRIFGDRVSRLNGNVHLLKDYMLQIREACQSQVDLSLNRIMYFFTIVTTIFLPLTLIVGWYGMNFKNMPELSWEYGYITVIVLSIIIIIACVVFIRKKKFLK